MIRYEDEYHGHLRVFLEDVDGDISIGMIPNGDTDKIERAKKVIEYLQRLIHLADRL